MKNPGIIVKMADGLRCIVYDKQPLLDLKGKVLLHLVDEKFKPILSDLGTPKRKILDVAVYNEEMLASTVIGYVD